MNDVASMIRIDSGNDTSGNPRRAYLALSSSGRMVGVWREGYEGVDAVPEALVPKAAVCMTVDVTRGWFRGVLERAAETGIFEPTI